MRKFINKMLQKKLGERHYEWLCEAMDIWSTAIFRFPIFLKPNAIVRVGDEYVCLVYNPYLGTCAMALGKNLVVVDRMFMRLSKKTKLFVLGHELGHMHFEHKGNNQFKRTWDTLHGRVDLREKQADLYVYLSGLMSKEEVCECLMEISTFTKGWVKQEVLDRMEAMRPMTETEKQRYAEKYDDEVPF